MTSATVAVWTAEGGEVVRDDGTRLPFAADAVDPVVRFLRPGQRVALRLDEGGTSAPVVVALTVAGLPFTSPVQDALHER